MKRRMSVILTSISAAALTAVVLLVACFGANIINVLADDEAITDVYQIDSEEGDDSEKPHEDSMRLMDDYTYDADFEDGISVFPDSYKNALRRIHAMYPNFTFVADRTGMKLSDAVMTQIENGYKTYRGTYTDDYNTIFKFMDPLTYLYPEYDERYDVYSDAFNPSWHVDADFFMFADHAYSSEQYAEALYYLIEGCDFLENEDMNSIIAASAKCSMNPYVMASTVILEKGWSAAANGNADVTGRVVNKGHVSDAAVYSSAGGSGMLGTVRNADVYIVAGGDTETSDGKIWYKIIYDSDGNLFDSAVNGIPGFVESSKVTNIQYFNTYYNLFSINQTDSNPVVGGIAYAMSHSWTSLAASFEGGASFCKEYYYDNDQTTYYYMHYNVLNRTSNWWHEYSTGVSAGLKCARILRYGYDYDHAQSLVLRIPVYESEAAHWMMINDNWYYIQASGSLMTGWLNYNGAWYYMNSYGIMQTGWQKIDGKWYYFDSEGVMQTGWLKDGSYWYYLNDSGAMQTLWQKIGGTWYYLDPSGRMCTGWQKIGGTWYYLKSSGAMQTGWLKDGSYWYYLKSSGAMASGWLKVRDDWYFLNASGAMQTGWLKQGNIWYYLRGSGTMATGWLKINNKWYFFNSSGAMTDGTIRIAICGTNTSETYQADDDIWQAMEDLGAVVVKVNSSVDVSKYDGLLIPGGIDIDPSMYGEKDVGCGYTDKEFDKEQTAIIKKFIEAKKPILGICRGCELLNIYFGGNLIQDISGHRSSHKVFSEEGTELYGVCGTDFTVSSAHHQAIDQLGTGFIETQWASDQVIEGIEHKTLPVIGVMWHPEWSADVGNDLIEYFVFQMCGNQTG